VIDNFILAINVVLPILIIIFFGYFIKQINMVDDISLKKFNNMVFKVFMPILLYKNISNLKSRRIFVYLLLKLRNKQKMT
jgi:predicted permease